MKCNNEDLHVAKLFPNLYQKKCPIHVFIRLSGHLCLEILDHHNDLLHRRHIHRICSESSGKEKEKRQHCRKIKREAWLLFQLRLATQPRAKFQSMSGKSRLLTNRGGGWPKYLLFFFSALRCVLALSQKPDHCDGSLLIYMLPC